MKITIYSRSTRCILCDVKVRPAEVLSVAGRTCKSVNQAKNGPSLSHSQNFLDSLRSPSELLRQFANR